MNHIESTTLSCLDHVWTTDLNRIQFHSLYVSDFFSGSYPINIGKKRVEIFAESQFGQNTKSFKTLFYDLFHNSTTESKLNPGDPASKKGSINLWAFLAVFLPPKHFFSSIFNFNP